MTGVSGRQISQALAAAWAAVGLPELRAESWATPPKTLGDTLADEIYRITVARGMEGLVLTPAEKISLVQQASLWMGV